ncbi:MAG: hypothetical protein HC869_22245 [Rhodospirillales bacterium]|nr:hypothetical protein [Rhodospirillales bacterium]
MTDAQLSLMGSASARVQGSAQGRDGVAGLGLADAMRNNNSNVARLASTSA